MAWCKLIDTKLFQATLNCSLGDIEAGIGVALGRDALALLNAKSQLN
jgi:hypothetical protein